MLMVSGYFAFLTRVDSDLLCQFPPSLCKTLFSCRHVLKYLASSRLHLEAARCIEPESVCFTSIDFNQA